MRGSRSRVSEVAASLPVPLGWAAQSMAGLSVPALPIPLAVAECAGIGPVHFSPQILAAHRHPAAAPHEEAAATYLQLAEHYPYLKVAQSASLIAVW